MIPGVNLQCGDMGTRYGGQSSKSKLWFFVAAAGGRRITRSCQVTRPHHWGFSDVSPRTLTLECGGKRSATPLCSTPTHGRRQGTAEARRRRGIESGKHESRSRNPASSILRSISHLRSPIVDLSFPVAAAGRRRITRSHQVIRPHHWATPTQVRERRLWSAAGSAAPRRFAQRPPTN